MNSNDAKKNYNENVDPQELIKNRLKDLAWLLNDLVVDLKTPVDIWVALSKKTETNAHFMSIARLFISTSIINLCKLDEAMSFYGKEIKDFPEQLRSGLMQVKNFIEERKIYAYRSKYLAHAFSIKEKVKRPLSIQDAEPELKVIVEFGHKLFSKNLDEFSQFIYRTDDMKSVVNLIHEVVKYIDIEVGGLGERT